MLVDPGVGFGHAVTEFDGWFPSKVLINEGIIAVATGDPFGSVEIIFSLQFNAGDVFHDIDQLVDGDEFAAAEVEGFDDVIFEEHDSAVEAVIDVHERAGLVTIAPDFDFMIS